MNQASLEKVFACPNLPTLPAVALKVLELTSQPDVSLKQVASVIEHDQAIAAKVLRTVNSSFYGLSKRCGSIQQALALLGLQTVKGLVLGFSLAKSVDGGGNKDISFDFLSYWRRSMYSAAGARHIAQITRRCDPDEAFVAALVQDIGMVALWRVFGDRYLQTMDVAGSEHRKLVGVERKTFEIDHAAVAGEMTRRWRFPEPIVDAVRCHHNSASASVDSMHIARTVELAGMAATVILGESNRGEEAVERFRTCAHEWFELRGAAPIGMLQLISDLAQQLARVFGLNVGEHPDIDAILAQAESMRGELPNINLDEVLEADVRDSIDTTTGLPDRTVFLRDLEAAFQSKPQLGMGLGVIIVGLDNTAGLNTRLGPLGADQALKQVGAVFAESFGKFGRAYRFVGAGFVGLLPKIDLEQLCRVAEGARRKVSETTFQVEGSEGNEALRLSVTCGAAICEGDPVLRAANGIENRDQLLRAAMVALANGQKAGANRVVLYSKDASRPRAEAA